MTSWSRLGNARARRGARCPSPSPPAGRLTAPGSSASACRDRPGSLAAITRHLAEHGVNVLRLEVLDREAGWAVDDFLVSGAGLPAALAELEPDMRPARAPAERRPPSTRGSRWPPPARP